MENRRGSGIFLGVIGVATLVVAIIGATFAYFSASAGSDADAISAGSTTLDLGFQETTDETVLSTSLIPAYDNIAKLGEETANTTKNGRCIDDNKNSICSVYTFMVGNPSTTTAQQVYASLTVTTNTFDNLYFRIYDITNGTETEVVTPTNLLKDAPTKVTTDDGEVEVPVSYDGDVTFSDDGKTLTLTPLSVMLAPSTATPTDVDDVASYTLNTVGSNTNVKKYKVVVWIRETETNQSTDTAKAFAAAINFTTGTGTGVTGVLAGVSGTNFTE